MRKRAITHLLLIFTVLSTFCFANKQKDDIVKKSPTSFYQLTIYHFSNSSQEAVLDNYLQQALIPALHKMHIEQVGTFKDLSNDSINDKKLYVLIPVVSLEKVTQISENLLSDETYKQSADNYINASFNNPPYVRIENILLKAFKLAPKIQLPQLNGPKKDRVYKLRSYESATEKIFQNKVHMFNEADEIGLFKKLNFNAIFYSEVVAGSKMPNLMYMTSFENMTDRNEHWKLFSNDPYWKKLSSMPEYQNNISHIDISFLRPTEYSDF